MNGDLSASPVFEQHRARAFLCERDHGQPDAPDPVDAATRDLLDVGRDAASAGSPHRSNDSLGVLPPAGGAYTQAVISETTSRPGPRSCEPGTVVPSTNEPAPRSCEPGSVVPSTSRPAPRLSEPGSVVPPSARPAVVPLACCVDSDPTKSSLSLDLTSHKTSIHHFQDASAPHNPMATLVGVGVLSGCATLAGPGAMGGSHHRPRETTDARVASVRTDPLSTTVGSGEFRSTSYSLYTHCLFTRYWYR